MDIKTMTAEELMERRSAIALEVDAEGADLDALENEARSINEELTSRKAEWNARQAELNKIAQMTGEPIVEEPKTMTKEEVRASKEYINAFVNYLKTEDATECRALLSDNVSTGGVPIPKYVEDKIRTAWDRVELMGLVKKTYIKGNLNVGFELSADPAYVHTEGSAANTAEALTFGLVDLTAKSIKKYIKISDEAIDLKGEAFLDYIYDELTYRIAKKAQAELIGKITALTASATTQAVGVGIVKGTPSIGVVAQAIGELSDEAQNPVIVMNKGSWAKFKAAQYAGNFSVDPFEGCKVYFDSSLPTYVTTGTANTAWAIVGDFANGAQANFPNGDDITIKYDDKSEAEADLVKIVGREYIGLGAVADHAFTKIVF